MYSICLFSFRHVLRLGFVQDIVAFDDEACPISVEVSRVMNIF